MSEYTRTFGDPAGADPEPNRATVAAGSGATSDEPGPAPPAPDGYELLALIGRGGMGAVYRARDLALGRDVALKFLLAHYPAGSATAKRFIEEARITARLDHPGIPPVHEVGRTPDDRPFLAMKLINGDTLDTFLEARKSPAEDRGRFVGIFEQVCLAVAFAHSRRIIHRDLKPSNVMVGAFGEVQVMDWGLAKDLRAAGPGAQANDPLATVDSDGLPPGATPRSEYTQAGSLLGTPAYMPPEQALSALDQITERSDVFGLGAILCTILTGKPPFVSESGESARILAARGKIEDAFARLGACGAEPDLIALAKRCLAPEPKDRPKDASEVAAAVAAFRADADRRARQAETDRATAMVKAGEERKRRHVQRALALAVLVLLAVAGASAWWVDHERAARRAEQRTAELKEEADRQARHLITERDTTAAINEAELSRTAFARALMLQQSDDLNQAARSLAAARAALKRAEGLLAAGEPTDELRARVAALAAALDTDERDLKLVAALDRVSEENDVRYFIPLNLPGGPAKRYEDTFRILGIDLLAVPLEQAIAWLTYHRFRDRLTIAVRAWRHSLPIDFGSLLPQPERTQVDPLDPNNPPEPDPAPVPAQPTVRDRLQAILDAITTDPFTREWWAAVERKDADKLKQLLTRPELARMSSRELSALADGIGPFQSKFTPVLTELLRIAYQRFPGEFWVNFRLATASSELGADGKGRREDTIRYLTAAVAARPTSALARVILGSELHEQNKDDPTGLRIVRGAAEIDPKSPWPHVFLAYLALERGDINELTRAAEGAIRADPDYGFLMISPFLSGGVFGYATDPTPKLDRADLTRIIDRLVAVRPDHPGGYTLRGEFRLVGGDARGAMADFRMARERARPGEFWTTVLDYHLRPLDALARWEQKLPAVLRGEIKPSAAELIELAGYCAKFDQKYALAVRFGREALAADPKRASQTNIATDCAGWAVRAGLGHGADAPASADDRAKLRRVARDLLQTALAAAPKGSDLITITALFNRDLVLLHDEKLLATLPPEERKQWEQLRADLVPTPKNEPPPPPKPPEGKKQPPPGGPGLPPPPPVPELVTPREVAPPPRPVPPKK